MKIYRDKVLKIIEYALGFTLILILVDYKNVLGSLILSNSGLLITVLLIVSLFVIFYIVRNGFFDFLKTKIFNEIDELLISLDVSLFLCLTLGRKLSISGIYTTISFISSIFLFTIVEIIRIIYLQYYNFTEDNSVSSDIVTLYDIYNNNFTIKDNIVVKEKAATKDLLNRELIIRELKDAMTLEHGGNSFTIGVEGEWGSGKTTLINLTLDRIINEDNKKINIISDFDPWIFGTNEALLESLYEEILKCIGVKYNSFKLRNDIKNLTSIVANVSKQTWIERLFDNNFGYSDLKHMKNELTEALNRENDVIIFVFDNLDRMDSENILFLFKLIGTIFDLPHINYVLSYDDKRLDDIFGESLKINPKYKEKIINQVIRVPELDQDKRSEIYTTCFENILSQKSIVQIEDISDYIDFLSMKVMDLRNFTRILNSNVNRVFFHYNVLNLNELLILELIRFRNKQLYELIRRNAEILVSFDSEKRSNIFSFHLDKEDYKNKKKELLNFIEENYYEDMDMVLCLFPDLRENDLHAKQVEVNTTSIRSAKYFDLYFSYGTNDFLLIYHKVNWFIQEVNNTKSIENIEAAGHDLEIFSAHKSIRFEIVNEIDNQIKNIERSQCSNLMVFFWNHIQDFSDFDGFFLLSSHQRAELIIAKLLDQLESRELDYFINDHLYSYEHIEAISEIKYWLTKLDLQVNEKILNSWTNYYKNMCEDIIKNNIDLYDDKYYSRGNIVGLKRYKKDYREMIQVYIRKIIKPKYVYRILGDCVGSSHGSTHNYGIDQNLFNDMGISQETIDQHLSEYKPENESQEFILDLYQRFKKGEKAVMSFYPVERNELFYFRNL